MGQKKPIIDWQQRYREYKEREAAWERWIAEREEEKRVKGQQIKAERDALEAEMASQLATNNAQSK